MINITSESLKINRSISNEMEGKTFHFHTHILYDIRTLLGKECKKYVEIGSYCGGSASLISSHPYKTECYCIDLGDPIPKEIVERNVNKFKTPDNEFRYIQGNSQSLEIIDIVKNDIKDIDILFIDGDHSKNGATKDYLNYACLVNKGGYIIFDDYMDSFDSPEVKIAVDEIVDSIDTSQYEIIGSLQYDILKEFTDFDSSNLFIIKKI
jgi:hypothetical protein